MDIAIHVLNTSIAPVLQTPMLDGARVSRPSAWSLLVQLTGTARYFAGNCVDLEVEVICSVSAVPYISTGQIARLRVIS